MQKQVTTINKTVTEVQLTREEVETMVLAHLGLPAGWISPANFDWNDQTGAVHIVHTQEQVAGS